MPRWHQLVFREVYEDDFFDTVWYGEYVTDRIMKILAHYELPGVPR